MVFTKTSALSEASCCYTSRVRENIRSMHFYEAVQSDRLLHNRRLVYRDHRNARGGWSADLVRVSDTGASLYPRRISLHRPNCGSQCSQSARKMGADWHPRDLGALHACDCVPRAKGWFPQSHLCESGDLLHPGARVRRNRQPSETLSMTTGGVGAIARLGAPTTTERKYQIDQVSCSHP